MTPQAVTTFWKFQESLLRQFWRDVLSSAVSNTITIVVAGLVAFLQARFGLIPADKTWVAVLANVAPYFIPLLFFIVYHGLRAPWQLHNARRSEIDNVRSNFVNEIASWKSTAATMQSQLEVPYIIPSILSVYLDEIPNTLGLPNDFEILLGCKDTIITLLARLENQHRVGGQVESCWLVLRKPYDIDGEKIQTHYRHPGFPTKRQATAFAEERLDVPSYVEYGIPVSGRLQFKVEHRDIRMLVGWSIHLSAQDGTGAVVDSESKTLT